ncbi:MAG TPA: hypothetical protein VHV83_21135, partial [Armatimonadota bacterium]|nr:hypothetical protein [Armatimonadota bacterium]
MRQSSLTQMAIALPLLVLTAFTVHPAFADITLGGDARAVAMGGAGLASAYTPEQSNMNPAALAEAGARFNILWPSISAHADGASYSDAFKLLGNPSLSAKDAMDYATSFGGNDTHLEASANAGILLPRSDIQLKASMRTDIRPNASFKQWANSGGSGTLASDARADVYAGGIATLPSVGIG